MEFKQIYSSSSIRKFLGLQYKPGGVNVRCYIHTCVVDFICSAQSSKCFVSNRSALLQLVLSVLLKPY